MSIAPTLRGFRLQDLYIIWRILTDKKNRNGYFLPEGSEDLLIFDSEENEIEAVQVKALKNNVTLSRLGHDKLDGFFTRQAKALARTPNLKVTLASFGPIGPGLKAALDGEAKQLASHVELIAQHNYVSKKDASTVLQATTDSIQDEVQLKKDVREWLERSLTGIDPDKALAVLQTWIRLCAESGQRVRYENLISEVESIGKFLREAAAHNLEWHVTIRPIEVIDLTAQRKSKLAEGFYQGSSVQYEHILAELDVERPKALASIESKFTESRVVVVKAASGQGKSAIAYRFIHNYCSARLCYRVEATDDPLRAGQIALAISSHAANIGVPMLVYLDVRPTDYAWRDIVLRLAEHPNIQLLITIREEDWTRGALSKVEVDHQVIEVEFSQDEASLIYELLREKHLIADTVNFEDAWNRFGREGQLIEFVHFISQGESLYERLEKQVGRLKEEVRKGERDKSELQLLRLVAIATAFEARIKARAIVEFLGLPEPQGTVRQFEREYLFRTSPDGLFITSLHPIRSEILMGLLTDPAFDPWIENAAPCIDLVVEADLANFLLYVFARSADDEPTAFLEKLNQTEPASWEMALGIIRALLWYGVRQYVNDNRNLFDQAFSEIGQALTIAIDFDVAGAAPEAVNGIRALLLSAAPSQGREQLERYIEEQTDKEQIYTHLRSWLDDRRTTLPTPQDSREWIAYAEVVFWIGWSKGSSNLLSGATLESIWDGMEQLPLNHASRLLLAVYYGLPDMWANISSKHKGDLIDRMRRELHVLKLEDDGEIITLHFVIPLLDGPNRPQVKDVLHYEAMKRIDLCRELFPNKKKYCTSGYGHKFLSPLDSTQKHIEAANLPLEWLVAINAQFRELILRKYRHDAWSEFAESIFEIRKLAVEILDDLLDTLKRYFQRLIGSDLLNNNIDTRRWNESGKLLSSPLLLPKPSGDDWGFIRITDAKFEQKSQFFEYDILDKLKISSIPPLAVGAFRSSIKYLDFWRVYNDVTRNCSIFLDRGQHVLALSPALASAKTEEIRAGLIVLAREHGVDEVARYSTLYNINVMRKQLSEFQHQNRVLLSNWLDSERLEELEKDEVRVINTLWHYWYVFAFHPEVEGLDELLRYKQWQVEVFSQVVKQFRDHLREMGCENLRVIEPHVGPRHDDGTAMWVTFDALNLDDATEKSQLIVSAMIQAERGKSVGPLDYYVYDDQCRNLIVTPLIRGRSIEWISFAHPMGNIGIQNASTSQTMTLTLCPAAQACGIEKWEIPLLNIVWQLRANAHGMLLLLQHLKEVMEFPEQDAISEEVVNRYSTNVIVGVNENVKKVGELYMEFNAIMLDGGIVTEYAKSPGRFRTLEASVDLGEWFLPPSQDESIPLNKEELVNWMVSINRAVQSYEQQLDWIVEAEFEDV